MVLKKLSKPVGNLLLSSGSPPPPPPPPWNMKKCKQICRLQVRNGEKVKVAVFAFLWTLNVLPHRTTKRDLHSFLWKYPESTTYCFMNSIAWTCIYSYVLICYHMYLSPDLYALVCTLLLTSRHSYVLVSCRMYSSPDL